MIYFNVQVKFRKVMLTNLIFTQNITAKYLKTTA